ncbi:MAG: VTT domain-containing protein [Pseudomonadota bacterium]|nr:VTT domain-containing protein [Pseudomonadota bacterium]
MSPNRKFIWVVGTAVLAFVLLNLTPLSALLESHQSLKAALAQSGVWAPAVFTGVGALLVALGMPRLTLYLLGGAAFGFLEGLVWAQIGSLLGSLLLFEVARWGSREWMAQQRERIDGRFLALLDHPTVMSVFMLRQLPITAGVINMILALSPVSRATFLLGSFLGMLPQGVIISLIGSGLGKDSPQLAALQLVSGLLLMLAWGFWGWRAWSSIRTPGIKGG